MGGEQVKRVLDQARIQAVPMAGHDDIHRKRCELADRFRPPPKVGVRLPRTALPLSAPPRTPTRAGGVNGDEYFLAFGRKDGIFR